MAGRQNAVELVPFRDACFVIHYLMSVLTYVLLSLHHHPVLLLWAHQPGSQRQHEFHTEVYCLSPRSLLASCVVFATRIQPFHSHVSGEVHFLA